MSKLNVGILGAGSWGTALALVLAGKGHEDYQEIEGVKYDMDERVLVAEVIAESARTDLIRK